MSLAEGGHNCRPRSRQSVLLRNERQVLYLIRLTWDPPSRTMLHAHTPCMGVRRGACLKLEPGCALLGGACVWWSWPCHLQSTPFVHLN
ncbi:hypothetical protein GQ54DRAFT_66031 [Martensiomyces pterosporus]|nr:hypothetical protein GQ54DRAFT_66031 [Martensiomyces pterosporus]